MYLDMCYLLGVPVRTPLYISIYETDVMIIKFVQYGHPNVAMQCSGYSANVVSIGFCDYISIYMLHSYIIRMTIEKI